MISIEKIERFLAGIKRFAWGNEMEIPSREAARKAAVFLRERNLLLSHHNDGSNVWEVSSQKLPSLEANAEFTQFVLNFLRDSNGILHSNPSEASGVAEPSEYAIERAVERVCEGCMDNDDNYDCDSDGLVDCPFCEGTGKKGKKSCEKCDGTGKMDCFETPDYDYCGSHCEHHVSRCDDCCPSDYIDDYLCDDDEGYGQDTCSDHLHFSPYNYSIYKKLYQLVRAFSPLFCNSPGYPRYHTHSDSPLLISSRHQYSHWCSKSFLGENRFGENIYRGDYALTPNELGTIEFRYNDLSKSPQQVAFYGYLVYIADHLPFEMLRKEARKIDFPEDLPKAKKAKKVAISLAKRIERLLGDNIHFYNYYQGEHQPFAEMLRKTWCMEESAFEKFGRKEWDWSHYWTGRLSGYDHPAELIRRNGDGSLFTMNKKTAQLIMRENERLNVKESSDRVIAYYGRVI